MDGCLGRRKVDGLRVTKDNDAWQIAVSNIAGEGLAEVATGSGKVDGVAWLPEKKRLFYSATVDGVLQAFVTNVGSGRGAQITASETDTGVVDASPDGKSIIVTSAKEESNIWRVGVSDAEESPISRDVNAKIWPAVSFDNEKVAFQSSRDLSQGNKLLETTVVVKGLKTRDDAERPAQLAEHGFLPAWSPDGSSIAFLRENNTNNELFLINPNGGSERKTRPQALPPRRLFALSIQLHGDTGLWVVAGRFADRLYLKEKRGIERVAGQARRWQRDDVDRQCGHRRLVFLPGLVA